MTDLNELFKVIAEGKKQYEDTDPVGQQIKQAKEHVKEDLSSLFAQLSTLKEDLEKELVVEEAKLVSLIDSDSIKRDAKNIVNEVFGQIQKPIITEEIPAQPIIHTPEVRAKQVEADVDKYLTDKSFQQPNPDLVTKNIDDIRNKIKFLEQAIGRVAAAGPGGGEVNLRYLDDIDRSTITDGWYLRYSASKKKFEFAEVISSGGNGATGVAGATGPGGGDTGATGITGASGAQGASGLNGSTGPTGASGAAGINGATGTQGASGSVGASGVYTSTETLDSVTTRGNTTDNEITVRAVNIPNGATGASGINNIVSGVSAIIANISNEELNAVVEYGNLAALDIGDYGLPFGITGVPYVVYELKATPSPALQVDDVVGGAYIPVGSKLLYVGSGTYSKIIITDKNFASGALLPVQNTVLVFARETVNQGLSILTPANTDITINPGAGGHIVPHADIIPYTTNEWSLGSPAKRFKEVWLGTGTIYVQDETLGNDQALGAKAGNFYIKGGAGLEVGEWTLRDNTLQIKDSTRDVFIGQLSATADVVFNRSIKVQDSSNRTSFKTDRTGRTQFYPPSISAGDIGGVSIIGSTGGAYQPVTNAGGMLHITGNDGAVSRITNDAFGTGAFPAYISRVGRGTAQAPSAIVSGDILSRYSTVGFGATVFGATGPAATSIEVYAKENFTDTAQGTEYRIYTAPIGSTAKTLDLTINTEGLSFSNTSATTGITFYDSTRLTYFPTQVGQDGKYLKVTNVGGQDLMSWEPVAAAGSGATGAQGASGIQGASGTNGTNGATGTQGASGVNGSTGAQGIQGASGSTGLTGATGVGGSTGAQGASGIGATGLQGASGATGTQGVSGLQGASGANGTNGATGINGIDGATGTAGTNGIDGATGVAGNNGATGTAGINGATGSAGTNGINGATGISGATGSQGIQGSSGSTGVAGINGATGTQGIQGASGATGAAGTNGTNGATGIAGNNGATGIQGITGASGVAGTNGATGVQGASGATGTQGASGVQGASGSTGLTGATGINGASGATGIFGASGITGASGSTGIFGASGITGASGAQGIQGASGSTGLQGASGATGLTGAQGLSNSIFYYSAKTNSQNVNVYPSDGNIIWNNSTQINSSILSVPHITGSGGGGQGGTDIDVILSLVQLGQQIIIQDQDESGNYQTWTVSSTPTVNTSGANIWYNFPITLVTSSGTGTSNFSNNSGIVLIIATNAPGATGIRGATGLQGASGATGTQGASGVGATGLTGATGPAPSFGSVNWAQTLGASGFSTAAGATGTVFSAAAFTGTGSPIEVTVCGDANPLGSGGWCRLQLYRDNTAIGTFIQAESSTSNENVPYAFHVIDNPGAGTFTYSLRCTVNAGGGFQFGEASTATFTVKELSNVRGATGVTGATGPANAGPAFSAYGATGTTLVSSGVQQQLIFNAEEFDTGGCFNSTGATGVLNGLTVPPYCFCPNVSGYYHITGHMSFASMSSTTGIVIVSIYKNGTEYKRGSRIMANVGGAGVVVSAVLYLNGTGDYVTLVGLQSAGSNQVTEQGSTFGPYITGAFIRS